MRLVFVLLALVATLVVRVWADTTVFSDTCTEGGADVVLTSRTPDVGTSWTENERTTAAAVGYCESSTDVISSTAAENSVRFSYYATPSPALGSANYYVQWTQINDAGTSDDFVWLMLRRTGAGTYYGAGWYPAGQTNDCYIFKVVATVYSQIANGDCNFADTNVIRFGAASTTLTLYKDGVQQIQGTDSDIASAGAGGFGMGNIRAVNDDIVASEWDDFLIVDQTAAAGVPAGILRGFLGR